MLLNILLSGLSLYIDEIIGDQQCGFWRNRSTTDQIFCIRQILKKAYDSVRREVLYNILIEFGVPMKVVGLIKMCLNETYSNTTYQEYSCLLKVNCNIPTKPNTEVKRVALFPNQILVGSATEIFFATLNPSKNEWKVRQTSYDCFLSCPCQFITYYKSSHSTLYHLCERQ
jgi:hypothetical protein